MHAIMREQRIVGELISALRKDFVNLILPEFFFALPANALPLLESPLPRKRPIGRFMGWSVETMSTPQILIFFFNSQSTMLAFGPGWPQQVFFLVGIVAQIRIVVPSGVDEEDVALTHISTLFDVFRPQQIEFAELVAQVNNHARTIKPVDRDLIDRLAFRHEMARRIKMSAHVIGRLDVLRVHAVL